MNIKDIFSLLRISQWYKNLLIFIAIFLQGEIFDIKLFLIVILGFFVLCFASSASYIINDLVDFEKDRVHPEKRKRAIASGKINKNTAKTISFALLFLSILIAYFLNPWFSFFPAVLFLSTVNYTIYFKNKVILDLYFIAFNHVLRAVAGIFLISVGISSWFILFIFLLSMFLATGKKRADICLLGEDAHKHKKGYTFYTQRFIDWLIVILLASILLTYILYSFMAHESQIFMITIPFASFLIFRYLYFVSINHKIARRTEYIFLDKQMIIGLVLWFISALGAIYFFGGTK